MHRTVYALEQLKGSQKSSLISLGRTEDS